MSIFIKKTDKRIIKNKPIKIKEIEKKINSKFSYQTIKYLNTSRYT